MHIYGSYIRANHTTNGARVFLSYVQCMKVLAIYFEISLAVFLRLSQLQICFLLNSDWLTCTIMYI